MKHGIALAAALALAIAPLTSASAQGRGDRARDGAIGQLREKGMAEAPALVQQRGFKCTVSDALYLGPGNKTDAEGKPVKENGKPVTFPLYEVACSDNVGFIFGDPEQPNFDCLVFAAAAEQAKAKDKRANPPVCTLPANTEPATAIQPLVRASGLACTVDKARYVGSTAQKNLYEVGCSDRSAYLLEASREGGKPVAQPCFDIVSSGGRGCEQFYDKTVGLAKVAQLAAQADKSCQMTDARFVGRRPDGAGYTEIACAGGKGFMVLATAQGAFSRTVDCVDAEKIGNGCTLTEVKVTGDTQDLPIYTRKLKEIGHPCTPSKYRSLGPEPGGADRELVEIACSNQAEGLFAALALSGAAKNETYNCARAEARSQTCRLSDKKATYPQLSERMKSKGAACNIRDSRGIGKAGDQDVIEVACDNGPGYIVIFISGSEALSQAVACNTPQAAGIGGGCKLQ